MLIPVTPKRRPAQHSSGSIAERDTCVANVGEPLSCPRQGDLPEHGRGRGERRRLRIRANPNVADRPRRPAHEDRRRAARRTTP